MYSFYFVYNQKMLTSSVLSNTVCVCVCVCVCSLMFWVIRARNKYVLRSSTKDGMCVCSVKNLLCYQQIKSLCWTKRIKSFCICFISSPSDLKDFHSFVFLFAYLSHIQKTFRFVLWTFDASMFCIQMSTRVLCDFKRKLKRK